MREFRVWWVLHAGKGGCGARFKVLADPSEKKLMGREAKCVRCGGTAVVVGEQLTMVHRGQLHELQPPEESL